MCRPVSDPDVAAGFLKPEARAGQASLSGTSGVDFGDMISVTGNEIPR